MKPAPLLLALFLACPVAFAEGINPFPPDGEGTKFHIAFEKTETDYSPEELNRIFQVDGDEIHVYRDWDKPSTPFAAIVTADDYENFVIELEYKWGERRFAPRADHKRDAGLLFFVREPERVWPPAVECQIQETDTGDLWSIYSLTSVHTDGAGNFDPNGELTVVGKDGDFNGVNRADANAVEQPGWNRVRVEVRNGAGKFYLNDKLVNEFETAAERDGTPVTSGRIALQAEGAELTYRNVRIQQLD